MSYKAVIFDLGGVVLGSPIHAIARYERACEIPAGFVGRVITSTGSGGAWSRLERGELAIEAFQPAFEAECAAAGHRISSEALMARIAEAAIPRPDMLEAVRRIRERGLKAAALTNNWIGQEEDMQPLRSCFDAFIESSALGLRKPDRRIYLHACEQIGVEPPEAIFLDDIGSNLKTARKLGMTTIKVLEPGAALLELEGLLGFALQAGGEAAS